MTGAHGSAVTHRMTGLVRPLCIIDSEWTSGAPDSARLVQLCIRRLEPGGTGREQTWCINPEIAIEAAAQAVHGIGDDDVTDWPVFAAVAGDVAAMLAGADVGGYAIGGDLAILERQLAECGKGWHVERLAIVDALRIWQRREPRSLVDAYRHWTGRDETMDDAGNVVEHAHDAGADVDMTAAVIEAQAAGSRYADCQRCGGGGLIDAGTDPPSEGDCPDCGGYGSATDPTRQPSARDLHDEGLPGQLDPAGKFRRRDDGVVVFTFGPYRMLPVHDHHDFIGWMLDKDFSSSTKRIAVQLLQRETSENRKDGAIGRANYGATGKPGRRGHGPGETLPTHRVGADARHIAAAVGPPCSS